MGQGKPPMPSVSTPPTETLNLRDPSPMSSTPVPSNSSGANPSSPNIPVPPPHQPQSDKRDPRREEIASGFFIPFSEGAAWLKRTHDMDLPEDRSQDLTLLLNMMITIEKHGIPADFEFACGLDPEAPDILYVTQRISGQFMNVEPAGEEVFQDCFKEVMKRGELEDVIQKGLLEAFGIHTEYRLFFVEK